MDIDVVHRSIGLSQEKKSYLVLTLLMKLKQRYTAFKITYKLQSHAKRAMQTRGVNLYNLRLETMYT
jgi:hypothetical protein